MRPPSSGVWGWRLAATAAPFLALPPGAPRSACSRPRFARSALNKIFPDHWSFMLGEVAMYCFVILLVTGVYLTFFFDPSPDQVVYDGSYEPLQGHRMSAAYGPPLDISFDVRAGLVMRQMHHWAALVFIAAIVVHLCRVFFTGAFRRPREINWIVGVTLLVLAIANGFSGYSLPDDLLSGTGLRIAYSIALSIPVVGTWLAFLVLRRRVPDATSSSPGSSSSTCCCCRPLIVGLLGAHLAILWRQKHTQFRGPGRTEDERRGLAPVAHATRPSAIGLFCLVIGACSPPSAGWPRSTRLALRAVRRPTAVGHRRPARLVRGLARRRPPHHARPGSRALRPHHRQPVLPRRAPPGLTFGALTCGRSSRRRFTEDRDAHNLLDRPRDRARAHRHRRRRAHLLRGPAPGRRQDVFSQKLNLTVSTVTWSLRVLAIALPLAVALVTYRFCRDLVGADHLEEEKEEIRASSSRWVRPRLPPSPLPPGFPAWPRKTAAVSTSAITPAAPGRAATYMSVRACSWHSWACSSGTSAPVTMANDDA